eukprot:gene1328-2557_t
MSGARARSVGTNRQRAVVAPPIIDKVAPKPNRFGSVNAANKQSDGKVIGQYRLGKTLGEGTFGKVRLAIHIPTGEKVAVKVLEKNRIKDQADVRRVNREIKILKKANHSNIIQLYEVFDTNETIYLMMENADGGEMFDYIVSHRYVQERQACKFFHQLIDGVDTLHQAEITHRDLKPENLLLKSSPGGWILKIVDFGLSNTHENGRLLSTACGSPCYAAPEMIAGKQYEGPLADIWSTGVILFALVNGFLPFEDANTSILYRKILAGDYKPAKWISVEVKDLIRRILETEPKKRYTISDIRKHSWFTQIAEHEVPKEYSSLADNEQARTETMRALGEAGVNVQTVADGLASHACNANTAHFYLLEMKFRNKIAKSGGNSAVETTVPITPGPETSSASGVSVTVSVPVQNTMRPTATATTTTSTTAGHHPTPVTTQSQQNPITSVKQSTSTSSSISGHGISLPPVSNSTKLPTIIDNTVVVAPVAEINNIVNTSVKVVGNGNSGNHPLVPKLNLEGAIQTSQPVTQPVTQTQTSSHAHVVGKPLVPLPLQSQTARPVHAIATTTSAVASHSARTDVASGNISSSNNINSNGNGSSVAAVVVPKTKVAVTAQTQIQTQTQTHKPSGGQPLGVRPTAMRHGGGSASGSVGSDKVAVGGQVKSQTGSGSGTPQAPLDSQRSGSGIGGRRGRHISGSGDTTTVAIPSQVSNDTTATTAAAGMAGLAIGNSKPPVVVTVVSESGVMGNSSTTNDMTSVPVPAVRLSPGTVTDSVTGVQGTETPVTTTTTQESSQGNSIATTHPSPHPPPKVNPVVHLNPTVPAVRTNPAGISAGGRPVARPTVPYSIQ